VTALLVVAGAVVGAPLRYLVDQFVQARHGSPFPWGTLVVNAAGSLLLGAVAAAVAGGAPSWWGTLLGTGFCGALTTFSTFGLETVRLLEEGALRVAVLNTGVSLLVGMAACSGGWLLGVGLS
jgi:CrcB protein